jgi:hypothetical protein
MGVRGIVTERYSAVLVDDTRRRELAVYDGLARLEEWGYGLISWAGLRGGGRR